MNTLSLPPDKAEQLRSLIKAHCPSLSPENEDVLYDRLDNDADIADLALRTCACGVEVDGMYAFVDHLLDELDLEGISGAEPVTLDDGTIRWDS